MLVSVKLVLNRFIKLEFLFKSNLIQTLNCYRNKVKLQASQRHPVATGGIAAKISQLHGLHRVGGASRGTLLHMLSGLHNQEVNPEAEV